MLTVRMAPNDLEVLDGSSLVGLSTTGGVSAYLVQAMDVRYVFRWLVDGEVGCDAHGAASNAVVVSVAGLMEGKHDQCEGA